MTDQKPSASSIPPQGKPVVTVPKPPAPPPLPKPAFSVSSQAPKPGPLPSQQSGQPNDAPKPPASSILQAPRTTSPLPTPPLAPPATVSSPGIPRTTIPGTSIARPLSSGPALPKPPTLTQKNPPDGQLPPPPQVAEFRKSPLRFLPLIVAILLLVGLGSFLYSKIFGTQTSSPTTRQTNTTGRTAQTQNKPQVVLTYWGLWEPTPVLQHVLTTFEEQNPGVKVNYQQQSYRDYRERLQTAIAAGKGPDIFRYHASWVPMLKTELSEMPTTVYTPTEFQTTFFPIADQQLKVNGKYVGVPLMYDGLALFYNKEIFQTANVQPPKTWSDLKDLAKKLTVRNGNRIERAGVAVGNAANVDNFADILGLLMLQNGANPTDPTSAKSIEALQFYTDFYTKDKVWDETLPNSTTAFARGDVAMIIAPSWRTHDIIALNPNLAFETAPVPQLGGTKITWASYWAEGVNAQSKYKTEAWKLLKFLSSQEALQTVYSDASKERSFGEIYPRTDMANLLADSPYVAAYLADAPFAQDSYLNTLTHDNGLNDQVIKYYEDAITSISQGKTTPDKAVVTVDQGTRQILRQYNLTR